MGTKNKFRHFEPAFLTQNSLAKPSNKFTNQRNFKFSRNFDIVRVIHPNDHYNFHNFYSKICVLIKLY